MLEFGFPTNYIRRKPHAKIRPLFCRAKQEKSSIVQTQKEIFIVKQLKDATNDYEVKRMHGYK